MPIFLKILHKIFQLRLCSLIYHPIMYKTITQYGTYVLNIFFKYGAYGGGKRCAQGFGGDVGGKETIGENQT